jgi:hypothetical protein
MSMRMLSAVLLTGLWCVACGDASARRSDAPVSVKSPASPSRPVDEAGTTGVQPTDAREVTLPAGTRLPIALETPVGSRTSRVEQPVRAHLTRAIVIRGVTVVPRGSRVTGVVASVKRSGRVKGRAHVALRFNALSPRNEGEGYRIDTAPVGRTARATTRNDALEIGVPAAAGAAIGALAGGDKGALAGAAIGAGGGTAVVLSTRGREVRVPKGAALTLRLTAPVTIRVP